MLLHSLSNFSQSILTYIPRNGPLPPCNIPPASQSNPLLAPDATLLESMEKKTNKEELDKLDERLKDAQKTEGETEISDALKARANYLTRVGDKVHFFVFKFSF
jgi:hypothetical protein